MERTDEKYIFQLNFIHSENISVITSGPITDIAIVHHIRGEDRGEIKNYPEIENEDGVLTYNVTGKERPLVT